MYKERFGIDTPIKYMHDVAVDKSCEKAYQKAWQKFLNESVPTGSAYRRKRFNAFLQRIKKLGDDLPYTNRVEIKFISDKVGFGVFAKQWIPPYSILNHYAGLLRPDSKIDPDNDSTFMFSDFPKFSIDAQKQGNWCRFMNHGSEDQGETNVVAWEHFTDEGPHIIFTACHKGIKKGEQLLYSYGDDYWEDGSFEKEDL